ncbi:DUF397 domain-containing protein [Streptomyces sp. NPDC001251]
MAHQDGGPTAWFTSSYSDNQGGQCVQARRLVTGAGDMMAVRDSKDPDGGTVAFDRATWTAFLSFATEQAATR